MKQNMMFTDYPEVAGEPTTSLATLKKIQHGLLIGLGSVLTYAVIAVSSSEPFFDSFASIFLWIMLFLGPAAAGIVVLKFPAWQHIPLAVRKNVILQSFGLSFLTLSTLIVFNIHWNGPMVDAIVTSMFLSICYGTFILWLLFRLERKAAQEAGDLFP